MAALRFLTDEDIYRAVAPALRRRGIDAVSTPECGRTGESDNSQLLYATGQQRAIVTFNVRDFVRLHAEWLANSKHHAGIVVSQQRTIGDVVRRMASLAESLEDEGTCDRLLFLSDW